MEREEIPSKPPQPTAEPFRPRPLRMDKEVTGPDPGLANKIPPMMGNKIEEEKKSPGAGILSRTPEKKKPEISFKVDKGPGKKPSPGKEKIRILSCGQPRVSSPSSLEVPVTLEVEGAEKTIPFNINLSIKLEPVE